MQISMRREQQRNVALRHIEDHRIAGVVLFGGLTDIYDLRLLHHLRDIRYSITLHTYVYAYTTSLLES